MPVKTESTHDRAQAGASAGDGLDMLIVFRVGELRLGIDARQAREIVRAVPLSAPLPKHMGVSGMITLRGAPTAVVDLNILLGVPCDSRGQRARMIAVRHQGKTVCLLVDQVEGLHDTKEAGLEAPPPIVGEVHARWLEQVTRGTDGGLIGVIDVNRVLAQVSLGEGEVDTVGVNVIGHH
ncbi:MAG: purine-binding chemotaxis protein CheW [bacterium]|nr:purine-binding chemotaxis protein CheW [bacterium]